MELKRNSLFFLAVLLFISLISLSYATTYGEWEVSDDWTVSEDWIIGEASAEAQQVGQFVVFINDTGSLGFQSTPEKYVKLTVTSGAINSSVTTMNIQENSGYFTFRSNETVAFTVTHNISNVRAFINGEVLGSLDVSATQNDNVRVEWTIPIEPILPFMFILGMIGLGGLFGSSLYFVKEVKKGVNQEVFTKFITIFALSFGLFIAWLWGG